MLYKLLKREDQGLSPRKCFINILKRYYTAIQNRVLVYASQLANVGNVKTRISVFLLVDCILFLSKLSRAKYASPISAISLSESNSSHLSDTDLHIYKTIYVH